ncbi:MAG: ASCH domain-containing protein [Firmicutes bacterium]|nr:ASCH domain-containing protein [Bacillota bacterium]
MKNLEEWKFGGNKKESDELFALVLSGKKTATCCLFGYGIENDTVSILTNFDKSEKLKIKITKQYICKFCDVTKEHARKEGEGDLSIEYWQTVHKKYFTKELKKLGKTFTENIELCCEEFIVLEKIKTK